MKVTSKNKYLAHIDTLSYSLQERDPISHSKDNFIPLGTNVFNAVFI